MLLGSVVCTLTRERAASIAACENDAVGEDGPSTFPGDRKLGAGLAAYQNTLLASRNVVHAQGCSTALLASATFAGLSLSNQHTALLFAAPLSLAEATSWLQWALLKSHRSSTSLRRETLKWLLVAVFVGAFCFMIPNVYLLVVPQGGAVQGSWGNTGTVHGFITHILRREYGTFALSPMKDA